MLIALLAAVVTVQASGQPDRSCSDDNGRDVCAPAMAFSVWTVGPFAPMS